MTATYDPALATNRDHVRFLTGDTNVATARLSDEEIDAVLGLETATGAALPYFAAARCLEALLARWGSKGAGLTSKTVGDLSLGFGVEGNSKAAVEEAARKLRQRGAFLLSPQGKRIIRALPAS